MPDDSLTIDEGAVAPWKSLMWSLMTDICREMGVRTDVPFRELTAREKDIVFHGPAEKKHIFYHKPKNPIRRASWISPILTPSIPWRMLSAKVKDEKGMKRVEKFLKEELCPDCRGTRLSAAARAPKAAGHFAGRSLRDDALRAGRTGCTACRTACRPEMRPMARAHLRSPFSAPPSRLTDLGLGYLTLDRAASTLSTGERQRMQLARAVRNRTTGVLYVLDEPSIGLHPSNIVGLTGVMHDLVADGNSVILVDHDTHILQEADWIVEMGPEAGADGGHVIAEGDCARHRSRTRRRIIGPFLCPARPRPRCGPAPRRKRPLCKGRASTYPPTPIHTVKPLDVDIPKGTADRRYRRIRFRQDHDGIWKA